MKSRLATVLQLTLGIGLITVIFLRLAQQGELGDMLAAFRTVASHPAWVALALGTIGFSLLVCSRRWQLILTAQGFRMPFGRTVTLYLIGHFFNAFMLGATGGDLAKAVFVARGAGDRKAAIIATIFIERLIGLMALLVLVPVVMLARLPFFWARPETRLMVVIALAGLGAALAGLFVMFGTHAFERWPILRRLEQRRHLGPPLRRGYDAFHDVLRHRGLLARTGLLSLLNHLAIIACPYCLGTALGLPLGYIDYLTVFLVINLIASLPLTPSGIGTRETACILLLGAQGVTAPVAVTLALLLYASVLLWSLAGGLVYAAWCMRSGSAAAPPAAA